MSVADLAGTQEDGLFDAVVQHWAKARIDNPLQVASRLDDSARQLIAVGGILEGLLIAVFTFGKAIDNPPSDYVIAAFLSLLVMSACAAITIYTQTKDLGAFPIYQMLRQPGPTRLESLDREVKDWCDTLGKVVARKRAWLTAAFTAFIGSLGAICACTLRMLH